MVAGMVLAVLLTTGRTVGAQQGVVATLDDAGTRSLIVRAQEGAGLDSSVLSRLEGISAISWAGGFGSAVDSTNTLLPGGNQVAVRSAYGVDLSTLGITQQGLPGLAYASDSALEALGMDEASGSITTSSGLEYPIAGRLNVPDFLAFLEPLIIAPADPARVPALSDPEGSPNVHGGDSLAVLVVVAVEASQVTPLQEIVIGVADVHDPTLIKLETSERLAQLRDLIDAQLGGAGQALVAAIFGLTAVLVAAILYALIMMRRRDFGRRRALGASRGLILVLVMTQVVVVAAFGATVGGMIAFAALAASSDPQPSPQYYGAIVLLAVGTATLASLVPAIAAASRDPARELRVP